MTTNADHHRRQDAERAHRAIVEAARVEGRNSVRVLPELPGTTFPTTFTFNSQAEIEAFILARLK